MHLSVVQVFTILAALTFATADLTVPTRRSAHSSLRRRKNWNTYTNQTEARSSVDFPSQLVKRDGTKYVFMHHVRQINARYSYSISNWKDDITQIQAKGIDAVALNIGSDDWQRARIRDAYEAARQLDTNFQLFISLDFTELGCNMGDLVGRINEFATHPNQFKYNGKVFISSFGDCLGNGGWQNLKSQTNAYVMPFVWGIEGQFNNWPALDSWYCWGCAWPQGNQAKTFADDQYYIGQLGNRFATTVSGWMYTHYSYKNFYQRGDDWLIVNRWEQLVSMRSQLTFVEMVTWNDWGESDYFGPVQGDQPAGTTWATNYPHTAWFDLSQYYITAFKTGSYPAITKDTIYFWARPHPANAGASADGLGKPSGWDWTQDTMWAAVYSTGPATVILKCGGSSNSFQVNAGVNKLSIGLSPGKMTVQMIRNGQTIIDYTPNDYTYVNNPATYNYNAWSGLTIYNRPDTSIGANGGSTMSPTTTTPVTTPPTTTPTTSNGFAYVGCYQDDNNRVLAAKSTTDSGMTISKCQATCSGSGYSYFGVEYGVECYCANSIKTGALTAPENECQKPCGGDSSQPCGDGWRVRVFQSTSAGTGTGTGTTPSPSPTWSSYGCVAEGTTGTRRALTGAGFNQGNMTPQVCQTLCGNYQYAGVEYGECYCGNTLTNNGGSGALISASSCSSNCGGDPSQKCGGSWIMSVYAKQAPSGGGGQTGSTQWTSAGCYVDASTRMLRGSSVRQDGMTNDKCISTCSSAGYTMAGTEDGKECFCGSEVFKDNGAGVSTAANQCNTPCDGASGQTCGGGWRLNISLKPGTTI
ncbi:glycosyl hydrolase family 71-domain-containing protein [Crepidotus variabilis]|uniref:Glycosyl hydrolase family 71-domain-containing protein n=1 Tax=Crepidotus variabilis TaxID=179855 RepID=A0A9P6EHD2_9AGAR|nr:glycosyl hydrolase family 71-domain-containing protein [Crepidotus variabilis]